MLFTVGCGTATPPVEEEADERVKVFNGNDEVWISPEKGVAVNKLGSEDFYLDENGRPVYCGSEYTIEYGVDVSGWQQDIDWAAVKESGIDFAIIRIGARGYGLETGEIFDDEYYAENIEAAEAAGLKVGVYFFSQATNEEEAIEEADHVLYALNGRKLELPIYFDWEHISYDTARTQNMNGAAITDCAVAFCERVELAGYDAGVYMYAGIAYYDYELYRLTDYDFWCASIGDYPFFYYEHRVWQYSVSGTVPGISGDCDMNIMFIK